MASQLMATHFINTADGNPIDGDTIDGNTDHFICFIFIFIYIINALLSLSLVALLNSVLFVESNSYICALFLKTDGVSLVMQLIGHCL